MPAPSLPQARAHLLDTSVTKCGQLLPLSSGPQRIGSATGGVGIQLYFIFLKYVGGAFAVWAFFHLPVMICYIYSTGGPDGSGLVLSTAFNVGIESNTKLTAQTMWTLPGLGEVEFGVLVPWIGILDAAGLLCFMIIVGWFCWRTMPKIVQHFDDDNVTPSDFSVEIRGLPVRIADHEKYEQLLKQHIIDIVQKARTESKKGLDTEPDEIVLECCLVRDYKGRLLAFKTLEQLQKKLDNAREKLQTPKIEKQIASIEEKMEKVRKKSKAPVMNPLERNVCGRAYVMLKDCETKDIMLDYYRFANFSLFRMCQKEYMRFQGKPLVVVQAPEPSNIMWENQDRNETKVMIQKGITILLSIIMFSCSFVIIFAAKATTKKLQEDLQQCQVSSDPVTRDNWETRQPLTTCDCAQLNTVVYELPELRTGACRQWFEDDLLFKGLLAAGAIIVVVVNFTLQIAVNWFTRLEQPLNLSSFYASLAMKIAVAQFFNTGVIVLLVNSNLFNFLNLIGNSGFADFERQWYNRVGGALIITLFIQAFSPHVVQVFTYPVLRCVRRCKAATKQTQSDLNDLYTWPDFNLSVRLAGLLNVMLCTMLYSAGLPILSFSAMVTFFLVYFCDKFILLRASKMPPSYNEALLQVFQRVVPVACFLHACFAVYMFGNQELFPGAALVPELDMTLPGNSISQLTGIFDIPYIGVFLTRCLTGAGFGNFCVFIIVVIFFVLCLVKRILGAAFGAFFGACATVFCRRKADSERDLVQNRVSARKTRRQSEEERNPVIFCYAPESNPKYSGLIAQANSGSAWSTSKKEGADETSVAAMDAVSVEPLATE